MQVLDSVPNLTTTELAEAIGIDQTTATRTLALIRKSGLAIDTVGDDRRQRRWALTAEGQAQLRKLRPTWEAAQAAFEKRLGRAQAVALKKASYLAASRKVTFRLNGPSNSASDSERCSGARTSAKASRASKT